MTPKDYQDFLAPEIAEQLKQGKGIEILNELHNEIELTKGNTTLNAYERGDELNVLYFQLALIQYALKDIQAAAESAQCAFGYDAFQFAEHPFLVQVALEHNTPELDKFVLQVSEWHHAMLEMHGDTEDDAAIENLLKENANRSADIAWELEDRAFQTESSLLFEGYLPLEEILKRIEKWRNSGIDKNLCDTYESNAYYYADLPDKVYEIWHGRNLSVIPFARSFMRVCEVLIDSGDTLPNPLTLPPVNNPVDWYNALTSLLTAAREIKGDYPVSSLEPEDRKKVEQYIYLCQVIGQYTIKLFKDFENGKLNGFANSPHFYAMLCRNYGMILEWADENYAAIELYERGLELSPFLENAQGLVSAALEAGAPNKVFAANQWILENYAGHLSFEDEHMVDRFNLWARGLTDDLPAFLLEWEQYHQKYHELYRAARPGNHPDYVYLPQTILDYNKQIGYAANNIFHGMEELWKKYPQNPELVALMLDNRKIIANREEGLWAKEFLQYLPLLRNPQNDIEKERLFRALSGAGYLLIRLGSYEGEDDAYIHQGVELMREAMLYADNKKSNSLKLSHHCLELGRCLYLDLDFYQEADYYLTKAIELLEPSIKLPKAIQDNPERMEDLLLSQLPDSVLGLSYFYRAYVREALNYPEKDCISDWRATQDYTPTIAQSWYKLAQCLSSPENLYESGNENEANAREALSYAERFIDAYSVTSDNEEVGEMLSLVVTLLGKLGEKDKALQKLSLLEEHFPEDPYLNDLKKVLRPRKKLFGLF